MVITPDSVWRKAYGGRKRTPYDVRKTPYEINYVNELKNGTNNVRIPQNLIILL
jgi:hypothetical protein